MIVPLRDTIRSNSKPVITTLIITLIFLGFVFLPEIPAVLVLVYWFLLQFFSGIGSYGTLQTSQGGVAWFAHIGGFISGMILVAVMKTKPAYGRRQDLNW